MPKLIPNDERARLKNTMLKTLSVNGRIDFDALAKETHSKKMRVYQLLKELVEEYNLRFVPELNIDEIWKYEYMRMSAHKSTKRELREETIERIPDMGFEEYVIMLKFHNDVPSSEELIKAVGDSPIPQFMARLKGGKRQVLIYALARRFRDITIFADKIAVFLKDYKVSFYLSRALTEFGFFPVTDKFIETLMIHDSYKQLLLGLNKNGREHLNIIAKKGGIKPENMSYAMERLMQADMLKRITYYENEPKNVINAMITGVVTEMCKYRENKDKWFLSMVNKYFATHCEYVYMCDLSSPYSIMIIASFKSNSDLEALIATLKKDLQGMKISYMQMTETLIGNLGIRDFDLRYSAIYDWLARKKLVPMFNKRKAINF